MTATMRLLARWHIWLGWLVGVPLLLWTVSGLAMTLRPIEETRGTDRLVERPAQALAPDTRIAIDLLSKDSRPVISVTTRVERGIAVTRINYADGTFKRFRPDGTEMGPISEIEARLIAAEGVRGGGDLASIRKVTAAAPALSAEGVGQLVTPSCCKPSEPVRPWSEPSTTSNEHGVSVSAGTDGRVRDVPRPALFCVI